MLCVADLPMFAENYAVIMHGLSAIIHGRFVTVSRQHGLTWQYYQEMLRQFLSAKSNRRD
jgi:hypothetical protein